MRRTIPALSLLGALVFLPACAGTAAPTPGPSSGPSSSTTQLQVIRVEHQDAAELRAIVEELMEARHGASPTLVSDPKLNALIVSGSPTQHEDVRQLVALLDVVVPDANVPDPAR